MVDPLFQWHSKNTFSGIKQLNIALLTAVARLPVYTVRQLHGVGVVARSEPRIPHQCGGAGHREVTPLYAPVEFVTVGRVGV